MVAMKQLVNEIETLPTECLQEVMNFVEYLKLRTLRTLPETMVYAETSLAKDWNTPEEDKAWADL